MKYPRNGQVLLPIWETLPLLTLLLPTPDKVLNEFALILYDSLILIVVINPRWTITISLRLLFTRMPSYMTCNSVILTVDPPFKYWKCIEFIRSRISISYQSKHYFCVMVLPASSTEYLTLSNLWSYSEKTEIYQHSVTLNACIFFILIYYEN